VKSLIIFLSLLSFFALTVLSGCLHSAGEKEEIVISTCSNGIQDGSESGIDCGGDCDSCLTVDLSCNLGLNKVEFYNQIFPMVSGAPIQFGRVTLTGMQGGYLVLDFGDSHPVGGIYSCHPYLEGNGKVSLTYLPQMSTYVYYALENAGNIEVLYTDFGIILRACNIVVTKADGTQAEYLNFNVVVI
jgi:hypothetical protein